MAKPSSTSVASSSALHRGLLLATKLYVPPARTGFVPRPRLTERLDEALGAGCRLILLSASAGFGKTTLLSEWIHQKDQALHPSSLILHPSRVAWVSLDEGDNDPARFWAYVIAALGTLQLADARQGTGIGAIGQGGKDTRIALVLLTLVVALTSTTLGMLVAALSKSSSQAGSVGLLLGFIMAGIGGCIALFSKVPLVRSEGLLGIGASSSNRHPPLRRLTTFARVNSYHRTWPMQSV